MEVKKSPKADLERGKTMSLLMGFVVGLAVLFVGFEWGSTDVKVVTADEGVQDIIAEEEIEITRQENTPPPPPPPAAASARHRRRRLPYSPRNTRREPPCSPRPRSEPMPPPAAAAG